MKRVRGIQNSYLNRTDALSNSTRSRSLSHSVMVLGWRSGRASARPFLAHTTYFSYRFCLSASRSNGWNEPNSPDGVLEAVAKSFLRWGGVPCLM